MKSSKNTSNVKVVAPPKVKGGDSNVTTQNATSTTEIKPKKRKPWVLIVVILAIVVVLAIVSVVVFQKVKEKKEYEESLIVHLEQTSGYAIDNYTSSLNSFNLSELAYMGDGCFVDDELLMVNNNELTEQYIKWVCANTSAVSQNYTTKVEGAEEIVSFSVSVIDYSTIASSLDSDKIMTLMSDAGLSPDDVDFSLRIQDVFCEYMLGLSEVPKTTVTVDLPVLRVDTSIGESPYYVVISNDRALDGVLFCSDEFHDLIDKFGQVSVGWTGTKSETYITQEEQENPEYTAWLELLNSRIEEYPTWSSNARCLYEPYYLRDENGNIVKDENGNKVVEFYVLFEPNDSGKKVRDSSSPYGYRYIPEPEHTIMVDVERERQVEDTWVEGSAFPYSWIGYWYVIENGLSVRYGDGTQDYPLGIGTWSPTKLTLIDGSIVDAEIELVASYRGADAVQFALDMSEKNRGLDSTSVVELVICEFKITNVTDSTITFSPDMVLVDEFGSKLSRTGTVYGLPEEIVLGAGESVIVVDWCTSTDMSRYQVAWGRSFSVSTPMVFFDVVNNKPLSEESTSEGIPIGSDAIIMDDEVNADSVN